MKLSLATCAEWMGGELVMPARAGGDPDAKAASEGKADRAAGDDSKADGRGVAAGEVDFGRVVEGYSIDSRTVLAGELFFAVAGERYDAHSFVAAAMARGAAAAVVARGKLDQVRGDARDALLIAVDEPLLGLQRLGAAVRRHWAGTLIGLTGSAGKTTTKEMVAAVLGAKYLSLGEQRNLSPENVHLENLDLENLDLENLDLENLQLESLQLENLDLENLQLEDLQLENLSPKDRVLKSEGNFNNHFGVPLQLLRLEPEHAFAVIEMGMSHAGEIALLGRLAAPDWAVVTNVGMAHAQNFADGIEGIALAKRELVDALSVEKGVAFLNVDDARVAAFAHSFAGRVVRVGRSGGADVEAVSVVEQGVEGLSMMVHAGRENEAVHLKFLGAHNVANALLALAVGLEAGVPLALGKAALGRLLPGERRGELLRVAVAGDGDGESEKPVGGLGTARVINDCYNSNPAALAAMIGALMGVPGKRHILVAGEMLELGPETGALHAGCGEQAALAGVDWVIGVQGAALALAEAAAKVGTPALFLKDADEAGAWLRRELRDGDAVLLKGSRGVRLERALDGIVVG